MGSIFENRAKKAPFQRTTAAEREDATEYTGMADGSDPTSTQRRPMSAAEQRREVFRAPQSAPAGETAEERMRRQRAGGYGTQIRR